ncbi:MAG: sugar phosphate isomerase/epimerase [Clostridia bacterium]|nr:sugar phosphate isomerase/epimerase [Clostridia bacterium]
MKKGISYWSFTGKSYKEAFEYAKNAGFDGVEVTLNPEGEVTMDTPDEQILEIKKQADEAGIELYSVATGLFWSYSFTSNDKAVREKAIKIARRELEIAKLLGCDSVLVVPGLVDEDTPYDVAYDRALCAMRELAPYAEELGVMVGVENVWNKFMLSPLEYRDFIDKVGSSYVKAYFDVGNVVYDGWPEQWISILGNRICKIHIKDYIRNDRTLAGFCELLDGDVDFAKVLAALESVGYNGFCTAEMFAKDDKTGFDAVEKAAQAYKKIFM